MLNYIINLGSVAVLTSSLCQNLFIHDTPGTSHNATRSLKLGEVNNSLVSQAIFFLIGEIKSVCFSCPLYRHMINHASDKIIESKVCTIFMQFETFCLQLCFCFWWCFINSWFCNFSSFRVNNSGGYDYLPSHEIFTI